MAGALREGDDGGPEAVFVAFGGLDDVANADDVAGHAVDFRALVVGFRSEWTLSCERWVSWMRKRRGAVRGGL